MHGCRPWARSAPSTSAARRTWRAPRRGGVQRFVRVSTRDVFGIPRDVGRSTSRRRTALGRTLPGHQDRGGALALAVPARSGLPLGDLSVLGLRARRPGVLPGFAQAIRGGSALLERGAPRVGAHRQPRRCHRPRRRRLRRRRAKGTWFTTAWRGRPSRRSAARHRGALGRRVRAALCAVRWRLGARLGGAGHLARPRPARYTACVHRDVKAFGFAGSSPVNDKIRASAGQPRVPHRRGHGARSGVSQAGARVSGTAGALATAGSRSRRSPGSRSRGAGSA